MDPHKMTIKEIDELYYGRNVEFTLKNGKKKTIFVEDILDENDNEPELTFIGGSIENEIGISNIVSAKAI